MAKRPDSPLATAAIAFDDELTEYARLAELLLRTPLGTTKQLERVNLTIEELAATEQRLSERGRGLVAAIGEARDRQQQLAEQILAHLPAVHARNQALREILGELQQLGSEVRELNASAGGAAVLELEERVTVLAGRAEAVAVRAREERFEDSATQAHALHQQMLAVVRKLRTVTSRQS